MAPLMFDSLFRMATASFLRVRPGVHRISATSLEGALNDGRERKEFIDKQVGKVRAASFESHRYEDLSEMGADLLERLLTFYHENQAQIDRIMERVRKWDNMERRVWDKLMPNDDEDFSNLQFVFLKPSFFRDHDRLLPLDAIDKKYLTVRCPGEGCVFVSHRWLMEGYPDPEQEQFRQIQRHARHLYQRKEDKKFVYWVDFSCVHQGEFHEETCFDFELGLKNTIAHKKRLLAKRDEEIKEESDEGNLPINVVVRMKRLLAKREEARRAEKNLPINVLVFSCENIPIHSPDYMQRFWCRYEYLMGHKVLGLCSLYDLNFMTRLCSVYSLENLEKALDHPYSVDLHPIVDELVQHDIETQLMGSQVTNMEDKKKIMDDLRSAIREKRDYHRPAEMASRVFALLRVYDMEGLTPTLRREKIKSLSRLPPHLRHRLQVTPSSHQGLDKDDKHD